MVNGKARYSYLLRQSEEEQKITVARVTRRTWLLIIKAYNTSDEPRLRQKVKIDLELPNTSTLYLK